MLPLHMRRPMIRLIDDCSLASCGWRVRSRRFSRRTARGLRGTEALVRARGPAILVLPRNAVLADEILGMPARVLAAERIRLSRSMLSSIGASPMRVP